MVILLLYLVQKILKFQKFPWAREERSHDLGHYSFFLNISFQNPSGTSDQRNPNVLLRLFDKQVSHSFPSLVFKPLLGEKVLIRLGTEVP